MAQLRWYGVVTSLLIASACGGLVSPADETAIACAVGETSSCSCSAHQVTGSRSCSARGQWESCVCPGAADAAAPAPNAMAADGSADSGSNDDISPCSGSQSIFAFGPPGHPNSTITGPETRWHGSSDDPSYAFVTFLSSDSVHNVQIIFSTRQIGVPITPGTYGARNSGDSLAPPSALFDMAADSTACDAPATVRIHEFERHGVELVHLLATFESTCNTGRTLSGCLLFRPRGSDAADASADAQP